MNIFAHAPKAAAALLAAILPATLPAQVRSIGSAQAPAPKSAPVEQTLRLGSDAQATVVRLDAPAAATLDLIKRANGMAITKRLQIGIGRDVPETAERHSDALTWLPVPGGWAAHWSVTSTAAKALRVGLETDGTAPSLEIRFAGSASRDRVYGPFTGADLLASAGKAYWSPVLEGDTATVELYVAGDKVPSGLSVALAQVSHLLASPADPQAEAQLKIGESGSCEVNVICRAATDAALAFTEKAVARMTFQIGSSTFLCTGTLLNAVDGAFTPYFYTANHCIGDQATASTLTTHWFYESTACSANLLSPSYTQLPGGATLLFRDGLIDASFMRLNRAPPAGVTFAGWDANPMATGTPMLGIHHPAGDLKKVSLATMGGYTVPSILGTTIAFIQSNWNSLATGVTEGGSSGSGIFTNAGSDYLLRGGLLGGPSSCTASAAARFDWYSRFDLAFPSIQQFLAAAPATVAHLSNISTRGIVGTGNDVLIAGFIIGGATSKTVVVVGTGPALAAAGITNPLPDPTLTLVRSADGAVLTTNDDWTTAASAPQIQSAGLAPSSPLESAVMVTLPPGAYTAILSDNAGRSGVGIVAVYEVDHPEVPLVNISTRGQVLTGNDVMIGGVIVSGTQPQTIVVTGTGPSLSAAGIANPLPNPTLTLVRSSDGAVIATNDDWTSSPNAAQIQAAGLAPASPLESAIMVTVPPGAYTAILSDAAGGSGVGIIAAYAR